MMKQSVLVKLSESGLNSAFRLSLEKYNNIQDKRENKGYDKFPYSQMIKVLQNNPILAPNIYVTEGQYPLVYFNEKSLQMFAINNEKKFNLEDLFIKNSEEINLTNLNSHKKYDFETFSKSVKEAFVHVPKCYFLTVYGLIDWDSVISKKSSNCKFNSFKQTLFDEISLLD